MLAIQSAALGDVARSGAGPSQGARSTGRASRRGFLKIGSLGLAGLILPNLLRAEAEAFDKAAVSNVAAADRRGTAVILYWMAGGPSHLDTWDMKPEAVAEVRGPFKPIATRLPGLQLCELLPHQAAMADKLAIVRSLAHRNGNHFDAAHWVQTGYHEENVMGRGQPYPCQGAIVAKLAGPCVPGLPPYVCIPQPYSPYLGFYQQPSYLGEAFGPLSGGGEPAYRGKRADPEFILPTDVSFARLAERRALMERIDGLARRAEALPAFAEMDQHYQRAFGLVTSPQVQQAFNIEAEPARLRERYGRNPWGQGALLARRLVEAGVRFVTINHYEGDVDWWDDHFTIEANLRKRLPPFDQALGTLIADIHERGLADRVLVAAFGEFGRTPWIDRHAGRGHWPNAMSALFSGGGLKTGQIIGSTTSNGGEPKDRPFGPGDLLATIYRAVGIDPGQSLPNRQNRPIPLVDAGQPIPELF